MQQRQTTTKSDIKEAFIQLLATKSLEDITISQLTKKAGVNRSTFYLHYLDKQDFLEQLKEETLSTVRMILRKETFYPKEALEAILSYFQENGAFFAEIAKNPSFRFADNIRSFILGMIESTPRSRPVIVAAYQMPERYYHVCFWFDRTYCRLDYQWDSRKPTTIDQNYTGFSRDGVV
mgnify:CR=1 FL=1